MNAYLLAGLLVAVSSVYAQTTVFYASPTGDDGNPGTEAQPFATLERARDAAREVSGPVTVRLQDGLYELERALELDPRDSGLTFAALDGANPIVSGGRPISGWTKADGDMWKTELPQVKAGEWYFHQLFVRGPGLSWFERRYRPSRGLFVIAGLTDAPYKHDGPINHRNPQDEFFFRKGDISRFENLDDVELVAMHDWSSGRLHIREIDADENIVRFKSYPHYRIGHWYEGGRNPYLLENLKEDLGKPGQWYLDRPTGTLLYTPLAGESIDTCDVVAPRLERLVTITGEADGAGYVQGIRFQGITFAHSSWKKAPHKYAEDYNRACRQGFVDMPAAVELKWARDCRFERCDFVNMGAYGLDFGVGSHENAVVGGRFLDLGAGGVKVGTVNRSATFPEVPTGNIVENNMIHEIGLVHYSAHAIWGGICAKTLIRHNDVSRTLYSSIAVGWSHDKNVGACRENVIEWNHVHDVLLLLDHGGAVYTLGNQPGTVIRGNHIHGTHWTKLHGKYKRPDWAAGGLAFDDGSSGFTVEKNILYDIAPPADLAIKRGRAVDMSAVRDNVCDIRPGEPGFPEEIAARAGLEPEYRDLLSKPFRVVPPPVLSMRVPEDVAPGPIRDSFDRLKVGGTTRIGYARLEDREPGKGTDAIAVTDETAADGPQCLKIVDAPGLSREWIPYLSYSPRYISGVATVKFALMIEEKTQLEHVWRGSHPEREFSVGPQFSIKGGALFVGERKLSDLPVGEWVRFAISAKLGKPDPGIGKAGNVGHGVWNLAVTLPDGQTEDFPALTFGDAEFDALNQVMFISLAQEKTTAYLDSVEIRSE